MSTIRGYNAQDISADTGEVEVIPSTQSLPGLEENIVTMRLRMKTHTPEDPYVGGQMIATLRWHDGGSERSWDMALATTPDNYAELPQEIWADGVRDVSIQVQPLVAGGSVDVLLDYVEL